MVGLIEQLAREALELGELPSDTDPARLAIEVDAMFCGGDANFVLLEDRRFLDEGRAAVRRLLGVTR